MALDKQDKVLNVPTLRFPEYTGEWKTSSVKDCLIRLENGANYDANDIEGLPMSRIETISTSHIDYSKVGHSANLKNAEHYKMNYGDILFSHINSVRHIGKTAYYEAEKPLYHGMNLLLLRCGQEIDSKFFFYLLNNRHFLQRCQVLAKQAVNQASISISDLRKIGIYVPQHDEQERIAKFLSIIDERITTQIRIIEELKSEKKYLLEQLFCLPNEQSPRLRIKGHTSQWQKVRLSDIVNRIVTRNKNNSSSRVLTIAAQYGLIDQQEFFHKQIASSDLSGYYLLKHGDFAYNKSYSGDYPWGAVKRLDNYPDGVLSTLYICFRPNDDVDSDFLCYYFESTKWYRGIMEISGEGARNHGLLNMSVEDYFATRLRIPIIEEQRDISKMLNTFSQKIKIEEELLDRLQKQKAFLLTSMFV